MPLTFKIRRGEEEMEDKLKIREGLNLEYMLDLKFGEGDELVEDRVRYKTYIINEYIEVVYSHQEDEGIKKSERVDVFLRGECLDLLLDSEGVSGGVMVKLMMSCGSFRNSLYWGDDWLIDWTGDVLKTEVERALKVQNAGDFIELLVERISGR